MALEIKLPFDVAWNLVAEWNFVSTVIQKQKVHRLIGDVVTDIEKFIDVCEFVSDNIYEEEYDRKTDLVVDVHIKDTYDRNHFHQILYSEAAMRAYPNKYDLDRIAKVDKDIAKVNATIKERKPFYYMEKYFAQFEDAYHLPNYERYDKWHNTGWWSAYDSSWWAEQQY